jgi:drug/metabolite transporter (DMT)-like permease
MTNPNRPSIRFYIGLHLAILLFSFSGVFSKLAGRHSLLSWQFILFYGINLGICGVYAILWQQFLKHIPLNTAYSNRMVTMIWSMVWGALLFQEQITLPMLIGTAVILFGLRMVVTSDE